MKITDDKLILALVVAYWVSFYFFRKHISLLEQELVNCKK